MIKIRIKLENRKAAELGLDNLPCEYVEGQLHPETVTYYFRNTDGDEDDEECVTVCLIGGDSITVYKPYKSFNYKYNSATI